MKRLILLLLSLVSINVYAHQANLSGFTLSHTGEGQYTAELGGALVGVEAEINRHYGKTSYADAEAFKALVSQHFEKTVSLTINETAVKFQHITVILGHETKVIADVIDMPQTIQSIGLTSTFFQEIPRSKMLVRFSGEDLPSKGYVLNRKNHYTLNISLDDKQ